MDREVMHLRDSMGVKFAENVYYGFWFAPEFELLRKTIEETQQTVTGDVRLKLYRGNVIVAGRRSPHSLYDERIVPFTGQHTFAEPFANVVVPELLDMPVAHLHALDLRDFRIRQRKRPRSGLHRLELCRGIFSKMDGIYEKRPRRFGNENEAVRAHQRRVMRTER